MPTFKSLFTFGNCFKIILPQAQTLLNKIKWSPYVNPGSGSQNSYTGRPFLDSFVQFLLLKCCNKLFFGQRSVQYYQRRYINKYIVFGTMNVMRKII